jgi:CheY-like chemotaxis protein
MVHGFAAQTGGTVRLESALGRGTTVQLYLPRAGRGADAPRRGEADAARRAGEPSRAVLVVEDDDDVRRVTAEALEACGYRPLLAANAADALEVLGRERVDMMVSDIVMPGMSGIELAQAARQRRRDMPVLLITGYAAALEDEPTADGVEVLRKPFLPADLCARLAALGTRHREVASNGC